MTKAVRRTGKKTKFENIIKAKTDENKNKYIQ